MRSLLLTATLAFSVARGALAQSFPSDDPIIRRIWTIGMDSSLAYPLAQALLDSIGPRLTGTPSQKAANDWILGKYRAWGITARAEPYGTWKGWRRGVTHLDLIQPRVRTLEAFMSAWGLGTPRGEPMEAPVVILPQVGGASELEAWLPQARGKFVLVAAPQPTCRPDDAWRAHADSGSFARMRAQRAESQRLWGQRLMRATGDSSVATANRNVPAILEAGGVRGILTGVWSSGWGVENLVNVRVQQQVPSIHVGCEDYGLLFRLAENNQGPVVRLRAEGQDLGEVPVSNVIAEIRGSQLPNEYVMLSAHFDSWDWASGATDNGTGTIMMLEAMRILKKVLPNPKRTILVGHWGGEEQGLIGSRAWAADHPDVVNGLQALFNQDNGTGRIVNVSAGGLVDFSGFLSRWLARVPRDITRNITFGFAGTPSSGGTDNASFVCYGAPAIHLGGQSWDYGAYTHHTNRDSFDKIVFDDLRNNIVLVATLAYLASEDPNRVPRTRAVLPAGRGGGRGSWPQCQPARRQSGDWQR